MVFLWCTVPGLINKMLQTHTVYTFQRFKKENLWLDDLMNQVTGRTPFLKNVPSWLAADRAYIKLESAAAEQTGITWPNRGSTQNVWGSSGLQIKIGTLWVGRWHNLEWHVKQTGTVPCRMIMLIHMGILYGAGSQFSDDKPRLELTQPPTPYWHCLHITLQLLQEWREWVWPLDTAPTTQGRRLGQTQKAVGGTQLSAWLHCLFVFEVPIIIAKLGEERVEARGGSSA